MKIMNKAYLLIGGNMGNRLENLKKARNLIHEECGLISDMSSIYETEAWGNNEQPAFLNQALEIKTDFSVTELMNALLIVEKKLGRIRKEKYGPRIIDLDIIFFNSDIYSDSVVTVPHPELQNRRFVLIPLEEIAGTLVHPTLKKSIQELLTACTDALIVKKFS
jgi:2-amino-4-hydroxy-6-hydroxymethyldihydropteridine diphosphokinase